MYKELSFSRVLLSRKLQTRKKSRKGQFKNCAFAKLKIPFVLHNSPIDFSPITSYLTVSPRCTLDKPTCSCTCLFVHLKSKSHITRARNAAKERNDAVREWRSWIEQRGETLSPLKVEAIQFLSDKKKLYYTFAFFLSVATYFNIDYAITRGKSWGKYRMPRKRPLRVCASCISACAHRASPRLQFANSKLFSPFV